jgi:autotransporter-associated beta strand protein
VGTAGNPVLNGNILLFGDCVFNSGGVALGISGVMTGPGGLIKNGSAPMTLDTNNTYTADTTINTGTLLLSTNGSIADSTPINIGTGAALDVSQRTDKTLTLASGQTLEGSGVLDGALVAGPGTIVSPGIASGTLTVTNTVTLSGTTDISLDQASATNTVLACNATIHFGGALDLTLLTGDPVTGASFKIFAAKAYSGSFTSITPTTPGTGQTWDTSSLATTGVIKVAGPGGQPHFAGITLSGTNLVISGTGGPATESYYVLTSTNLALPLTNWTRVATNAFNASGNFTFTNSVSTGVPDRYYLVEPQ